MLTPQVTPFFDTRTSTVTYVVADPESRDAIVIDPVLDYDPSSSTTWTESADVVLDFVAEQQLTILMVLETHAHADHLSGAPYVKRAWPDAPIAIGARIGEVQALFKRIYALPEDFPTDGRQFDRLLHDHEVVEVGTLRFEVMNTPGHTPADCSYRFGEVVFVGDTVFMPDSGAGRCDFPGGSASDLYRSVHERLYVLPGDTRLFVAHDYQPGGRELLVSATVAEHRAGNVAIPAARSERDFVQWREARDATLSTPKLLFQSIQVNIEAGELPAKDPQGRRFLKIPINAFQHDVEGDLSLEDATPEERMSETISDLSIINAKRPATDIVSGGQPSPAQIAAAGKAGFKAVLTTRGEGEIGDYDERGDVERAGMVFHELPVAGMGDLSAQKVQAFGELVESLPRPLLIHCGSGNRIGALFALKAAWFDGADEDAALQRGVETGLTGLAPVVRQLIQRGA